MQIELDFVFSQSQISPKSEPTKKLLNFIARQDPSWDPQTLQDRAKATF